MKSSTIERSEAAAANKCFEKRQKLKWSCEKRVEGESENGEFIMVRCRGAENSETFHGTMGGYDDDDDDDSPDAETGFLLY